MVIETLGWMTSRVEVLGLVEGFSVGSGFNFYASICE